MNRRKTGARFAEMGVPFAFAVCFTVALQDGEQKSKRGGSSLLRQRPRRRNLLFGVTLLALGLVFAGVSFFAGALARSPLGFLLYWLAVFLLVGFVLLLAIYDLVRIRIDHRENLNRLEKELADAAEEARELARELRRQEEKGASDSDSEPSEPESPGESSEQASGGGI